MSLCCVRAPHIKCNWNFGAFYVIPNVDTVVLGGTTQYNEFDTAVSSIDTDNILTNISMLFPDIRLAPVVRARYQDCVPDIIQIFV